jgi:hypothetical protein
VKRWPTCERRAGRRKASLATPSAATILVCVSCCVCVALRRGN